MSFEIRLKDEPLIVLTSLDEAETIAYAVGRENDIADVTIVYTPNQEGTPQS